MRESFRSLNQNAQSELFIIVELEKGDERRAKNAYIFMIKMRYLLSLPAVAERGLTWRKLLRRQAAVDGVEELLSFVCK